MKTLRYTSDIGKKMKIRDGISNRIFIIGDFKQPIKISRPPKTKTSEEDPAFGRPSFKNSYESIRPEFDK